MQALGGCTVAAIAKEELIDLMDRRPTIRHAIWIDSLIDSSVFREWVVNVGRRDAKERIAHLLCELAARLKSSGVSDGSLYDFPITPGADRGCHWPDCCPHEPYPSGASKAGAHYTVAKPAVHPELGRAGGDRRLQRALPTPFSVKHLMSGFHRMQTHGGARWTLAHKQSHCVRASML